MEWYQAGGAQFAAADYSYPAADGGPTSGAYGSFEDEPPLLEGALPPNPFSKPLRATATRPSTAGPPAARTAAFRMSRRSWKARCPANPVA